MKNKVNKNDHIITKKNKNKWKDLHESKEGTLSFLLLLLLVEVVTIAVGNEGDKDVDVKMIFMTRTMVLGTNIYF